MQLQIKFNIKCTNSAMRKQETKQFFAFCADRTFFGTFTTNNC